jgi:hypothetical protein
VVGESQWHRFVEDVHFLNTGSVGKVGKEPEVEVALV